MRAQAVTLTAVALALINVGLAALIAGLAGANVLGGPRVAAVLLWYSRRALAVESGRGAAERDPS